MKKATATPDPVSLPFWAALGNAGTDQAAAVADCATAMFRGFEAMRKVQERAAHEAARCHATAASKLKQGCSLADVATIQGELVRANLEGASQYWQQLSSTAMEMQMRMAAAWNNTVDTETLLESLSAWSGKPH